MDILQECFSKAPVPPLSLPFATLKTLWDSVQRDRWSERQLRALTVSIAKLLCCLDSELGAGHLVDSNITLEIEAVQSLIKEINFFVQNEQGRGFLKLLFSKDERIAAIENYHRRLCVCATALQITDLLDMKDWQTAIDEAREADKQSIDDNLTQLEANQLKLKEVLDVNQNNMVAMMTSLQKAITKRLCGERERRFFSSTLNYLTDISGHNVPDIEGWMVTAYDVEFGPEIGSGGFGQVYRGIWNRTQVALKVLKTESGGTPSLALIRREVRTWSALLHPHILQFLGANVFDDRPFIVMPFLKNGNARDYVNDHPDCNRTMILHHISLGLVYLHHNNVIHGDLKALNVLIDDAGHAVLCDFGLSRIKSEASTRSMRQAPSVVGSRNWMSPERIMGGALRKPVDIYAFGMTMFEIVTGQVPLGHIEYTDFLHLVVDLDVRPERPEDDMPFRVSNGLWSLAESCWAKQPQNRPSAIAICDGILSLLASHSDASLLTSVALTNAASSVVLRGAPPKYESGPLLSSPTYSPTTPTPNPLMYPIPANQYSQQTVDSRSTHDADISGSWRSDVLSDSSTLSVMSSYSVTNTLYKPVNGSSSATRTLPPIPTGPRPPPAPTRPPTVTSIPNDVEPMYTWQTAIEPSGSRDRPERVNLISHPYAMARSLSPVSEKRTSVSTQPSDQSTLSGRPIGRDSLVNTNSVPHAADPIVGVGFAAARAPPSRIIGVAPVNTVSNRRNVPPSTRNVPPATTTMAARPGTAQSAKNLPAPPPSISPKPSGFLRVKNLFGLRSTPNVDNSQLADGADLSGFRLAPPRFSVPRSKSRMAEMWSVDDLINRWLERSIDLSKDEEFQEIFLMTYTLFTTCADVFRGLQERFDEAAHSDGPPQARAFRRHSIISAVIYWVSSPYSPVDQEVYIQMKDFASSVTSSSFMGEKAREIIHVINQKTEDYLLPAPSRSFDTSRALLENTADELAEALTILEGVMFSRIRPADYISHLKQLQTPNRVADAILTTRKITFWVKQRVLRSDQIKTRGRAFKLLLKTAEVCYETRNFSSMAAIVMALEADVIQCLSETLQELVSDDHRLLAKLSSFIKSEPAYRAALSSTDDSCVPRLEFHIRDLESVLPTCLPNLGRRSAEPVNLMGCITLGATLREIATYKLAPVRIAPETQALLYLMKQLDVVDVNARTNDELRQRSRAVKAQEASFRGSRARGLKNSGFV